MPENTIEQVSSGFVTLDPKRHFDLRHQQGAAGEVARAAGSSAPPQGARRTITAAAKQQASGGGAPAERRLNVRSHVSAGRTPPPQPGWRRCWERW